MEDVYWVLGANDDHHFVVMCYMIQFVPGRSYRVPSTWY